MPRGRASSDPTMLAMALVGYELEKQKIEEKIREIRARLGGGKAAGRGAAPAPANAGGPLRRRTLSAGARRRIAAAQRKRWAAHRKKLAQGGKGK
jgi:hypothetical protein